MDPEVVRLGSNPSDLPLHTGVVTPLAIRLLCVVFSRISGKVLSSAGDAVYSQSVCIAKTDVSLRKILFSSCYARTVAKAGVEVSFAVETASIAGRDPLGGNSNPAGWSITEGQLGFQATSGV